MKAINRVLCVILFCLFSATLSAQFAGGTGTSFNPFQVQTPAQLNLVRNYLSSYFIQIADIDLDVAPFNEGEGWVPIGTAASNFRGSYNGNNYKILNLFINKPNTDDVGLFGVANTGTQKNIIISNADVTGRTSVGALAGQFVNRAVVTNCASSGKVIGEQNVGGLAGVLSSRINVTGSYSICDVEGYGGYTGGLFGLVEATSTVTNAFARGNVNSFSGPTGGLIGGIALSTVTNTFSCGEVPNMGGFYGFGGLVGDILTTATINGSYWDVETSGQESSAGGTGKLTEEMKDQQTFTGWDFSTPVWVIEEEQNLGYPYLAWSVPELPEEPENPFAGGDGTELDPYQVATAEQLNNVRDYPEAFFIQIADIDLGIAPWNENDGWVPIGDGDAPFVGSYDGGYYKISNLYINIQTYVENTGLFGFCSNPYMINEIKNIVLENVDITAFKHVGGLVGFGTDYLRIINCSVSGSVTGEEKVGGLIGSCDYYVNISGSCSYSNVSSIQNLLNGFEAGGFAGYSTNASRFTDCSSQGNVSAIDVVGGFIGTCSGSDLINCYSSGYIETETEYSKGGFIAWGEMNNITNCYWDTDTSGLEISADGTPRSYLEMHDQINYEFWDFSTPVWNIDPLLNFGYPYLAWFTPPVNTSAFAGGDGSENDPYLVATPAQLDSVRNHLTSHFKQVADIDLQEYLSPGNPGYNNGEFWEPIGYCVGLFEGVYDGNGKTISNLKINANDWYIGLFSMLETGAEINNLNLINPDSLFIIGGNVTGSIAGSNRGSITGCFSNCNVMGYETVGCLTGENFGTVSFSYSTGNVTARDIEFNGNSFGGLTGFNAGNIENSYSRSRVYGKEFVGGLTGANSGIIAYCYSSGKVTGIANTGGLCGLNYSSIFESFWDIDSSYQPGTYEEGGRTHAEMLAMQTYEYWDFMTPVWLMAPEKNDGYPYLAWSDPVEPIISFAGGDGSQNDPYQIADAEQLNEVRNHLDAYFIQTADIDLSPGIWSVGEGWLPIGNSETPFTGNYNGDGHTISALTINRPYYYDSVGLFGHIESAEIISLKVSDADIIADGYTGILVGAALNSSQLILCTTNGIVTSHSYSGGLAGHISSGIVSNCYSRGTVSGEYSIGGFTGSVYNSTFTNCYSTAQVNGDGGSDLGGFAGYSSGSTATSSYWNIESSGQSASALGEGKTTLEMKDQSTYAGWDFDAIWDIYPILNKGNPYFRWENLVQLPLFAGGDGSEGNPYQITNVYQLQNMNIHLDAHYKIMNDIDASETVNWNDSLGFEPVGYVTQFFTGTLNGQNYTIDSLYINRPESNTVGLFGQITEGSDIKNINITNLKAAGKTFVGGLAGYVNNSKISNCSTSGEVSGVETTGGFAGSIVTGSVVINCRSYGIVSGIGNSSGIGGFTGALGMGSVSYCTSSSEVHGYENTGGFIGFNMSDSLYFCISTGDVYGEYSTGGFCGYGFGYSIKKCYSTGDVNGNSSSGGFIGQIDMSQISNCYSTGSTTGNSNTGGFSGISQQGSITNCFSTGSSQGTSKVGGFAGYNINGPITSCYWDKDASGNLISDGGEGKTTAEMKLPSTFIDWDFATPVWEIHPTLNDGYPYLDWQDLNRPLFYGGDGTSENPYQITNVNELQSMNTDLDAYYIIMNDIDATITSTWNNGEGFVPVGINQDEENQFKGKVDGQNYTIKNLLINRPETDWVGLFGALHFSSEISNIKLENVDMTGSICVGGLVSRNYGRVTGCSTSGNVTSTIAIIFGAGGFVGRNDGTITSCSTNANANGIQYIGGFAGKNVGTISNCYSNGDATGTNFTGGFTSYSGGGSIQNCYSTGKATGTTNTGGFVGYISAGTITDCFWDTETSGNATSAAGTGKTTAEMKLQTTFTNWDFTTPVWYIYPTNYEGYPYLNWEVFTGILPTVTTQAVTDIAGFTATGNAAITDVGFPDITAYGVCWSTSTLPTVGDNFTNHGAIDSTLVFTSIMTDLTSETTYFVRAYATNKEGTVYGDEVSFTTIYNPFAGGEGTIGDPYQVSNPSELNDVRYFLDAYFIQTADIDLNIAPYNTGEGWLPIGNGTDNFKGHYDGDNYTVSNLFVNRPTEMLVGLFGYIEDATLKNSVVTNAQVTGSVFTGCMVGGASSSVIMNCSSEGNATGAVQSTGGFAGTVQDGSTMSGCYSSGIVSGDDNVGGLIGELTLNTDLTDSYSNCSVTGTGSAAGGLVGISYENITITNCYSNGSVTGSTNVGGLTGSNTTTVVTSCFWDTDTSGQATSAGTEIGKTTVEMQTQATFINWDFATPLWKIHSTLNGGYPYLQWQGLYPFGAPQNVMTEFVGTEMTLTWSAVEGAAGYIVYGSSDPYTGFVDISSEGTFSGESWTYTYSESMRFFYIVADDVLEPPVTGNRNIKVESSTVR